MIKEILFIISLFVALTLCLFFVFWVLDYGIERKGIGEIILIGLISIAVYLALR